jgi:hypothetical protein
LTDASADLASYLISQSIGVTLATYESAHTGVPVCYGYLPDAPIKCTALYNLSGTGPIVTHDGDTDIRQMGVQAMVRSDDYDDASSRINAIYAALHKNKELTLNGTKYILIWAEQDFISLGWYDDASGRALKVVQNFRIMRSG